MHARQAASGKMREAEGMTDIQPHTAERLVKMGDHFLEHLQLKSAEINPMAPLENRNGDLAIGLAHRWIDLEGAPKPSAQVACSEDLVSLQPSTEGSWVGGVLSHCNQCVLQEKVSFDSDLPPSTMAT